MIRIILAASLLLGMLAAAHAFGLGLGNRFGHMGGAGKGGGGSAPVLTNLRITNTGDFRITNTTDNRAVFP